MKRLIFALALACSARATVTVCFIGDSITLGLNGGGTTAPGTMTTVLGTTIAVSNQGVSGTAVNDWSSSFSSIRPAAITACQAAGASSIVWIMLGTNDAQVGVATSQATYQSRMQTLIGQFETAGFTKIVLTYSPYITANTASWTVAISDPLLVLYQAALQNLAAADPTHVFMGDTLAYSYFQAHPTELSDGVHPNATGYTSLGTLWAHAYFVPFTLSGPSSGAPLTTSSTFTVALPGTLKFASGDTLTLSDGGAGGTFSTGTTITPTVGSASATFTYTPSVLGVFTIGVTSNQANWVNPSSIAYSATTPIVPSPSSWSPACTIGGTHPSQSISLSASPASVFAWSVASVQTWLSFVPTSGNNAGSFTATANCDLLSAGTSTDTITVSSSTTGVTNGTAPVSMTVYASPSITNASPFPSGFRTTPYSQALTVSGGQSPYTWSISTGALPPGLSLSGSTISGTPTALGTYSFTLRVLDTGGAAATQSTSMSVLSPPGGASVGNAGLAGSPVHQ